jgi:hypothetical protein
VTGGKPIAVLLQSISGVSAINPLVAFCDIHGGKREVLFFYFVTDTTRDIYIYIIIYIYLFIIYVFCFSPSCDKSVKQSADLNGKLVAVNTSSYNEVSIISQNF